MATLQQIMQQFVIGLSVGATYALIALGYTMVYGVLRLINFAHGEVYMSGAVVGYFLSMWMVACKAPAWVAVPVVFLGSALFCAVMGFLIEFLAYRPLRSRPRLVVLITAIGVSLLLQNLGLIVFGPTDRLYPRLIEAGTLFSFSVGEGRVRVSNFDALSLGLSIALMIVLSWVVLKTRTGLALRAVSYRFDTAMLMGINTDRTISFAFILGSVLSAVAGVLDGMRYNVYPLMGVMPGLKAFVAAVLGGIGNIPGALLGSLLIGLVEAFLKGFLPSEYTGYTDAAAFVILILILLVKPSGLLGRPMAEKV